MTHGIRANVAIPRDVVTIERSSVLIVDDADRRWRLPRGDAAFDAPGALGPGRVDREVCTERDLFNCHGTFYELPAENAGGFARIRPVATHNRRVHDYCAYRGLLVMTGIADGVQSARIVRSADGRAAVWVGVVDDLWELGRPRGTGGPWLDTPDRSASSASLRRSTDGRPDRSWGDDVRRADEGGRAGVIHSNQGRGDTGSRAPMPSAPLPR